MGSTCILNINNEFKTNKEFYEYNLKGLWNDNVKVLNVSFVGSKIYELLKMVKDGVEEVFIGITVVTRYKGSEENYPEICYKTMSEDMGPCYYDCPVKFLKASTSQNEYAVAWRAKCLEWRKVQALHKEKIAKEYKSLPRGSVVKTVNDTLVRIEYHNVNGKTTGYAGHYVEGNDQRTFAWKYADIKEVVDNPDVKIA